MPQYVIDAWTPVHFCFFVVAAYWASRWGVRWQTVLKLVLVGAVGWELVENLFLEPLLGFQEPWWNRWGTDVLADMAGACIGTEITRPVSPSGPAAPPSAPADPAG